MPLPNYFRLFDDDEEDPLARALRNTPYRPALPDALRNPISTPIKRPKRPLDATPYVETAKAPGIPYGPTDLPEGSLLLKDWRIKPSEIPGIGSLKPLLAGGKAIYKAATKLPLGGEAKVATEGTGRALDRALLRPAIPGGAVEGVAGLIPGARRESKLLGRLSKDVELGVPALLSYNPLVDFGIRPEQVNLARKEAKPTSPAKIVRGLNEIAGPTMADIGSFGIPLAAGIAMRGTEKGLQAVKAVKTGARLLGEMKAPLKTIDDLDPLEYAIKTAPTAAKLQPLTEPKRISALMDAIPRREVKQVVATNDLERLGEIDDAELLDAFMKQLPKSKPEKAEILTRHVDLPPMKPDTFINRDVMLNKVIDEGILRADEVIRHAASLPGQERYRDALTRLADGLVESHRKGEILVGQSTTELEQVAKVVNTLKGKDRDEAARRIAQYISDPEYRVTGTGSDILDGLAEQMRGTLEREFVEARKAKPDLGYIEDYLPQTKNDDVEKALELYRGNRTDDALAKLEGMYDRTGVEYPGHEKMKKWLEQKNVASVMKRGIKSFAESIDLEREMDFPGSWTDYRDPKFTADKFFKSLEEHLIDSGKRIADAQVFGPEAGDFKSLLNSVDDDALQNYIEVYRSRLLNQSTPLEHEKGLVVGMLRNMNILSSLGRSGITQNIVQPLITSLPASVNTLGFQKGIAAFGKGVREAWGKGSGERQIAAQKIGAVNAQVVKDLTSLAEDQPLSGAASRFLDWTLMSKSETKNNLAAYNIGRNIAPELADMYWRGDAKVRSDVANRVRQIFDDQPQQARNFIQSAELGGANALPVELIDEMGYQSAVKTQFRFGAKHLPLFWLTPSGKLLTQFKSFTYNNGRFLEKEIIKPAMNGNVGPLVTLMGSGLLTGAYTRAARKALRGERVFESIRGGIEESKDEERMSDEGVRKAMRGWLGETGEEMANDLSTGLSLTIMGDIASAGERGGEKGLLEWGAGPTLTKAAKMGGAAFSNDPIENVLRTGYEQYAYNPFGLARTAEDKFFPRQEKRSGIPNYMGGSRRIPNYMSGL